MASAGRARERLRTYRAAVLGGAVVAALGLLRLTLLARDPSDRYVAAVPDDAFYYFRLARNMAESGSWTFDGTAPTTGFHPLYAYLLVLLQHLAGDLDARTLLVVVGTASSLSLGAAATLTGVTTTRVLGASTVPLVVAVFATPFALLQATYLMESWLVVLAAAATVCAVSARSTPSVAGSAGLVALGVLGSLARSDFGMLPFALVAAALMTRRLTGPIPWLLRGLLVLGGAVVGLGLVTLQNYAIAGELLQASVRVKAHWAEVLTTTDGGSASSAADVPLTLLTSTIAPLLHEVPYAALLWAGFATLVIVLLVRRARAGDLPATAVTLAVACVVAATGYVLVYSLNADVQSWYTASFLVPCAVLLASLGRAVLGHRLVVPAVLVGAVYVAVGLSFISAAPWPNQVPTKAAALWLRTQDLDGPVAAWNAGVLAFYSGRDVVNLDGLVNDDVVPSVLSDTLADYVDARGIEYIVDYDYQFTLPARRARGGDSDGRLAACLSEPVRTFRDPGVPELEAVQVRRVVPGCLAP